MNRKKNYMLLISMLLFQFFVIAEVSGREVRPFETEGSIGFTGVYVPIGLPDPPPDTTTDEPNAPIRIARPDPNISNNHRNFPKTNANKSHLLFLLGVLLLFILWLYKKKESRGVFLMKMIRLATIAVLSSTIFSGGMTVFAEETRQVTTEGQITFEPNTEEELVVIPPVSEPDVEISPEIPGTTGPLSIMRAVTMDFGAQIISNEDRTYNMVAEMATLANPEEDSPTEVPYVSFAQVQDVRGTNAGWDLKVSLSDFTSNTQNNVLTGAEIELIDPRIQYEGSNQENAPSAHANNLKLIPNEGAVSVMTAAERQGAGASSVVWGDPADLNAQFAAEGNNVVTNDAIQLSVPGSTAKDATTYRATLTWELTTTPGEDAGESA